MVVGRFGDTLGLNDGFDAGATLGTFVGDTLGFLDGEKLGATLGSFVGDTLGILDGEKLGATLGVLLGFGLGFKYSRYCKDDSTHLLTPLVGNGCVVLRTLNELYRADLRWLMEEL